MGIAANRAVARADVFPVHLSLPWGLAVGPWPHLPPPSRMAYRIGAPIQPDGTDADAVARLDAAVRQGLQTELDALAGSWRQPLSLARMRHRAQSAWSTVRALRGR